MQTIILLCASTG